MFFGVWGVILLGFSACSGVRVSPGLVAAMILLFEFMVSLILVCGNMFFFLQYGVSRWL